LLDVGGQDEAATDPLAQLDNPARDYSVCTIVEIDLAGNDVGAIYKAVDVFIDQGSRHFQSTPGHPSLAERLLAYIHHWRADHLICDATGIGEGLSGWLAGRLGASRVTHFKFTSRPPWRFPRDALQVHFFIQGGIGSILHHLDRNGALQVLERRRRR
jgi:hypothetical protein